MALLNSKKDEIKDALIRAGKVANGHNIDLIYHAHLNDNSGRSLSSLIQDYNYALRKF